MPVSAETLQPILQALYNNTVYLKEIIDYFEMPSALVKCVEINPACTIGTPVYYSSSTGRYEPAVYETTTLLDGRTIMNETAEVWGIVVRRQSVDTAIILIDGIYKVDMTASTSFANPEGKWYLDNAPGMLTAVPPNGLYPVYVCSGSGDGNILFRPYSGEFGALILQWKHELVCEPSGTS
jgi:hypothetical protein